MSAHSSDEWYAPVPDPTQGVKFHPDGSRPLVRAASFWFRSGLAWDPKEPLRPVLQGPADDPFAHLKWSLDLDFLDLFPVRLNPCLQWCYDTQPLFQGTLPKWRQSVCEDLLALVQELSEEQEAWLLGAPDHVGGQETTQLHLLALTWLLDLLQFPGRRQLVKELFWGFPLLGPLSPGTGWASRSHGRTSQQRTGSMFARWRRPFALTSTRRLCSKRSWRSADWVVSPAPAR